MMRATVDETRVPNSAGAAPKWPPATSQLLVVIIDSPSLAKAGHAATKRANAIAKTSAGMTVAQAVVRAS